MCFAGVSEHGNTNRYPFGVLFFEGIGALLAVTCVHVENFLLFATLLWGCLFFGAALVPVAVGIQLASVPFHQRSISSALSQFA